MNLEQKNQDQEHPQYKTDRAIVTQLLETRQPTPETLANLARLKIRYGGFPGARDIQADLETVMRKWGYTEEVLYEETRQLHATGQVYKRLNSDQEDWV
ncbi:MAG: DUF3288 family protein [Actinomycetota bacterium]